jgi:hypothetical protein
MTMALPQPRTFLQRLLGTAPPASNAAPLAPQPDPADLGTAYGLDLSFAQQAYATPLPPPSATPTPRGR